MTDVLTLDGKGAALAVAFGVAILFLGQNLGPFFLFEMLFFLVLAALATRAGISQKKHLGVYEATRGWKNVVANGLAPLAVSFIYFLNYSAGFLPRETIAIVYVASVAAVTADKFASEIGILDGGPVMLMTLRRVKKGTSGGVNVLGVAAGFAAAAVIGSGVYLIGGSLVSIVVIAMSGLIGDIVDSVLGYWEEEKIGNKYTSNFACSVAGAVACAVILTLL
ncbi:MAG: DUF92 domain-containing protein [Candidatus Micrarchaeota archaeon]|nr:DUF92 domain-containing protein [Candidatus Micrarchaeota archaeon]